jgi:hypothetical protein
MEAYCDFITSAAGCGKPGYADGPLSAAYFDRPAELAALPDGSVLVADTRNNCIRRFVINILVFACDVLRCASYRMRAEVLSAVATVSVWSRMPTVFLARCLRSMQGHVQ